MRLIGRQRKDVFYLIDWTTNCVREVGIIDLPDPATGHAQTESLTMPVEAPALDLVAELG